MAQIELLLEKQLLTIQNQEIISSGDMYYDTCSFMFDGMWEGFTKTAVFYQDKGNVQYAVLDMDGVCMIPAQAMAREGNMYIGVFGIDGPKVLTSTMERVYIRQGAISGDTVSMEPSDDVFLAIIAQYQRIAELMQGYDATAAELSRLLSDLNAYDVSDILERLGETEKAVMAARDEFSLASGGLRFGMDADGNWGYIVPGSEDVIAFGAGRADDSGELLKTYQWQVVECSEGFIEDGRSWSVEASGVVKRLFLAVKVPDVCKTIVHLKKGDACSLLVYLNDAAIVEDKNYAKADVQEILPLVKGVNYIFLECWLTQSSNDREVSISFAPIVV